MIRDMIGENDVLEGESVPPEEPDDGPDGEPGVLDSPNDPDVGLDVPVVSEAPPGGEVEVAKSVDGLDAGEAFEKLDADVPLLMDVGEERVPDVLVGRNTPL